ncbi:hypothetical protein BKA69DRAFT_517350 [Paraphysoderma sedebokerense]|nr:hypothetical protein BKA69DRAFT_517350 [Paraphysoderma sedebokerense]
MRARAINLTLPNPNSNAVDINPSFELTLLTSMNDVVAKVRESITRFTTTGSFPISIAGPIDWSLPNSNDSAQATAEQFRSPFPFAIESAPWLAQVTSDLKIDVPIPLLVNAVLTQFPQIVTLLDGQNQNNPVNPDPAAPPGTNLPINLPIRIPPDLLPNLFNLLNSLSVSTNVFVSPDQKLLNIPVEIQNLPSVKVVPTFRVNYTVGVDVGLPLVGSTGVRLFVGDVSLQSSTNTPDLRRLSLNITLLSSSDSAFVFPIQTPQTPVLTSPPSPDPAVNPVIPSPNSDPQINPSLPPPPSPSSFSSFLSSSSDGTSSFIKNVMSGLSNQVFSNLISTVGSDGFMKLENLTITPSVSSYLSSLSSSTPSTPSTPINSIPQSDSSSPVSVQSVSSSAEPTQPQPQPQSQQSETKQTGSECILCSTFNQFGFQVPLNDVFSVTAKFIQNML